MFTPQRKPWSGWTLTPRREQNGSATGSGSAAANSDPRNGKTAVGKDKGLLFMDSTPNNLAAEKYADLDKEALCDKLSKLENEVSKDTYFTGTCKFTRFCFFFLLLGVGELE